MNIQHEKIHQTLSAWRYEFLTIALLCLLFDKIFVPNNDIYITYVWPINMLIMAIASVGIFKGGKKHVIIIRNILFSASIIISLTYPFFVGNRTMMIILLVTYIIYYIFIFIEVIRQITKKSDVNLSVILGSLCGYLLLVLISLFIYVAIEYLFPGSFKGIATGNPTLTYNELAYFSMITITSTGYGDILPVTDTARYTSGFFAIVGNFYMVVLVGIIISKFTAKN